METKPRFYLPELDGLRFIAFMLVFVHNAPSISSSKIWTALHEYGWIGVDLFFCLSGFLITKLLVMEHERTGEINIRNFYYRRVLRIWPLYFFYLAIGFLFIIFTDGWHPVLAKHLAGLATFTYDFVVLFLTYKAFAIYFHLWTVSYEEQFYIIIPWVIQKVLQNARRINFLFIFVVFTAGNLIRIIFIYYNAKHPAIYMLPITHFEAMLGGIAIGLGLFDDLSVIVKNWILLSLGLVLISVAFLLPNVHEIGWGLAITYPVVGLGMTLIVISLTKSTTSGISNLLRNDLLVYLGKISYGLYMFHLLSLSTSILVTQKLSSHFNIPIAFHQVLYFFIGLSLTILLSIASYIFLEKPFLKLKDRYGYIISRAT